MRFQNVVEGGTTQVTTINAENSGQSYKHFTLVNYDSRVIIWGIFQSGTTLES